MSRPLAVARMRAWVSNYMTDEIRITRDWSDPDDWALDDLTGAVTEGTPTVVWQGRATIQAPDQTLANAKVDRIEVRIPADVAALRHDQIEILQSPKDKEMIGGVWYAIDVDYGTHHVTRRLVCGRVERPAVETPRWWSE